MADACVDCGRRSDPRAVLAADVALLVEGVPGPVDVRATTERVDPGEAVTIEATVADPSFVDITTPP